VDARHLVEKIIWTHYVLCAQPVSTIKIHHHHQLKLPSCLIWFEKLPLTAQKLKSWRLHVGRQSYNVGRQKQGMKYSGPYTSSIDTNSYQPLSHCYITAQMIKQLCLFMVVISLIS